MAAAKAVHPPRPVKNENRHINRTEPEPALYAIYRGKYPTASMIEPSSTAGLGPFLSTNIPIGSPQAYMPKFPARPTRLLSVVEYFKRSANCGAHAE